MPRGRQGIGLALSGGGFRAALFHMGALRRLFELGVLQDPAFRTVSSVSGGSITAAAVAQGLVRNGGRWPADLPEWERLIEKPLRDLTRGDLRTGVLARKYLLPWRFLDKDYAVEAFAARLEERLTPLRLRELPERPVFALCATDLSFGAAFIFSRERMGSWQAGWMKPPEDFSLATAAATSAAFPPLFGPLRLKEVALALKGGKATSPERQKALTDFRPSDGGVYDNLGVEPIWKSHAVVLVSDGSGLFQGEADSGVFWRVRRYQGVQEEQARRLRRRALRIGWKKGTMAGASWSVGGVRGWGDRFGPRERTGSLAMTDSGDGVAAARSYSLAFAREVLAKIRTDLDAFSDVEAGVLMNHGYLSCAAAMATRVASVGRAGGPVVAPFPSLLPPNTDEAGLRVALAESGKRKTLGRG